MTPRQTGPGPETLTIGVLASHTGTTLQAVIDACRDGRIAGRVGVVISNNRDAEALRRAEQHGIPYRHLSRRTCWVPEALDELIAGTLRDHGADVVLLAGYLRKVGPRTLAAFDGRILNVHPSLLPRHGGQGMYGRAVHEAVLASGDRVTGASVHVVTADYDDGPVVSQREVPVDDDDDVDTLSAKVRLVERVLVVETLDRLARGRRPVRPAERQRA
jgi:phosphoribosylglycinamide formyltransferase 1